VGAHLVESGFQRKKKLTIYDWREGNEAWISWWSIKNELSLLSLKTSQVGGLAGLIAFAKQYRP